MSHRSCRSGFKIMELSSKTLGAESDFPVFDACFKPSCFCKSFVLFDLSLIAQQLTMTRQGLENTSYSLLLSNLRISG